MKDWPTFDRRDALKVNLETWRSKNKPDSDSPFPRAEGGAEKFTWREILDRLGPEPTPDDVDKLLPNRPDLTRQWCDECSKQVDRVIRLGQDPPDYDYSTIDICESCLTAAAKKVSLPA